MLKLFDFECGKHGRFEDLVEGYPTKSECPTCGTESPKIMSAPAIHTLETHMRGYQGDEHDGGFSPAMGFRDPNLTDEHGKPMVYSTLGEKRKLLKQRGLEQKDSSRDWTKQKRSKRPMRFTKEGKKSSQLGTN